MNNAEWIGLTIFMCSVNLGNALLWFQYNKSKAAESIRTLENNYQNALYDVERFRSMYSELLEVKASVKNNDH